MLQNHLRGSVTKLVIFVDVSQNWLDPVPIHYIVIRYPKQIVKMAFCDLLHTFHNRVTNVSQHVFVILLWGILTSPLNSIVTWNHYPLLFLQRAYSIMNTWTVILLRYLQIATMACDASRTTDHHIIKNSLFHGCVWQGFTPALVVGQMQMVYS